MEPRFDYVKTVPEAGAAMMGLEKHVHQAGLDRRRAVETGREQ